MQRGEIFPPLSVTKKEERLTSIFLAVFCNVQPFADEILKSVGQRAGKRTTVRAFTEVTLAKKISSVCRPDGLIVCQQGSKRWCALIEAKAGRDEIDEDQVRRYVELARENEIDAVITISNQFVTRADQSPVNIPKTMLRKTKLFHWSWAWIATQCEILCLQNEIGDALQLSLSEQFLHFVGHSSTGTERFTQMNAGWTELVSSIRSETPPNKSAPEVEETLACWFAETKDLSLHMSSHIGTPVAEKIERSHRNNPEARIKIAAGDLVNNDILSSALLVPNCAADINIVANLSSRSLSVSMMLRAPTNKKSTAARIRWLLRMIASDDEKISVRAHWPGRAKPTILSISKLREQPNLIQTDNPKAVPHGLEVLMLLPSGRRFSGRRTFIEDLEELVPDYYDNVARHLRSWRAPPPEPVKPAETPENAGSGKHAL